MKIKSIEPVKLAIPPRPGRPRDGATVARRREWRRDHEVANPMSKYPHVKARRSLYAPKWGTVFCQVGPKTARGGWA